MWPPRRGGVFRASLAELADIYYTMLLALIIVPAIMFMLRFVGREVFAKLDYLLPSS